MKNISLIFMLIMLTAQGKVHAADGTELIRATTTRVLEQLQSDRDRLAGDPDAITSLARNLIVPYFDFEQMSALILGTHWQELSATQRQCFVPGLRDVLVERYAYLLLSYDGQEITYPGSRNLTEQGYTLIQQTISREGASALPVEYAIQVSGDEARVMDLIIDGVSLVRNYRGMYQSMIHLYGLDRFIKDWPGCSG